MLMSIRYKGFSALLDSFRKIGLLDQTVSIQAERWQDVVPALLATKLGVSASELKSDKLINAIRDLVGEVQANETIEALAWCVRH
jgi:hypothetical protein